MISGTMDWLTNLSRGLVLMKEVLGFSFRGLGT